VPGSTFVIGQRHPCGCAVSFVLFTFAGPHTVSAISRTSLFCLCLSVMECDFRPSEGIKFTEVSGVENIGQCGRLSQLSWLLGAL